MKEFTIIKPAEVQYLIDSYPGGTRFRVVCDAGLFWGQYRLAVYSTPWCPSGEARVIIQVDDFGRDAEG